MLFNPTERNINPFQIPAGARTMKKLVLALAIHDKNVTMAKPAQVTFTIRTGLTSPSEKCRAAKTHRYNELGITTLSKQRFVIAVPSHTRFISPMKVQVRGSRHLPFSTPGLHQGCDSPPHTSKQRPAPPASVRPDSGASPVRYEQVHGESPGTAHAVWYDPFLTQSPAAQREEKRFSPRRAPRNNHTPDRTVFSNWDQPNMFLMTLPGPGGSEEPSRHEGRAPDITHPVTISCSGENFIPWLLKRPSQTSTCNFDDVCCGEASFSTAERLFLVRVLVLGAFVPPRTQAACNEHELLCSVHPMNYHA